MVMVGQKNSNNFQYTIETFTMFSVFTGYILQFIVPCNIDVASKANPGSTHAGWCLREAKRKLVSLFAHNYNYNRCTNPVAEFRDLTGAQAIVKSLA